MVQIEYNKLMITYMIFRQNLLITRSRQKSCADVRWRAFEFAVGDDMFLKVSPMNGIVCSGTKENLSLGYIEPYVIIARVDD